VVLYNMSVAGVRVVEFGPYGARGERSCSAPPQTSNSSEAVDVERFIKRHKQRFR